MTMFLIVTSHGVSELASLRGIN